MQISDTVDDGGIHIVGKIVLDHLMLSPLARRNRIEIGKGGIFQRRIEILDMSVNPLDIVHSVDADVVVSIDIIQKLFRYFGVNFIVGLLKTRSNHSSKKVFVVGNPLNWVVSDT